MFPAILDLNLSLPSKKLDSVVRLSFTECYPGSVNGFWDIVGFLVIWLGEGMIDLALLKALKLKLGLYNSVSCLTMLRILSSAFVPLE